MHDLLHLGLVLGAAFVGVFAAVAAVMTVVARNEAAREQERILQVLAGRDPVP